LELSGIGRRDVLPKIDVSVKLELEGVGENAQEHVWAGVTFRQCPGHVLRFPGVAEKHVDLFAQSKGVHAMGIENFTFQPLNSYPENAPLFTPI